MSLVAREAGALVTGLGDAPAGHEPGRRRATGAARAAAASLAPLRPDRDA
nr:hypothetical protein [Angustibacter aerolatus]